MKWMKGLMRRGQIRNEVDEGADEERADRELAKEDRAVDLVTFTCTCSMHNVHSHEYAAHTMQHAQCAANSNAACTNSACTNAACTHAACTNAACTHAACKSIYLPGY
jgi:hypothetical protein